MLSKWLYGPRFVVFYEIGHSVVAFSVSADHKLPRLTLVYHKMSTPVPASAWRQNNKLKPRRRMLDGTLLLPELIKRSKNDIKRPQTNVRQLTM